MSQIDELQRRITAALDRIGQGLDNVNPGGADAAELDALRKELEDERLVNAQLEERLKSVSRKQKERDAAEQEKDDAVRSLDAELQSLRKANQMLRDNNKALREANQSGVSEPHLINKSILAELEGLRAARAVDSAEIDAIMADLSRLIAGAPSTEAIKEENA